MLFYRSMRLLFRGMALPMFRFRVEGADRVPARGPGVVVAPHRSWLDPACVAGAVRRPVHFLIMDRVYYRAGLRWFYRGLAGIPVRTGEPLSVASLRGALRALHSECLIGIFPEGRVMAEGPMGPLQPGAALLAIRGRAPVIPVAIDGSSRAWPHGRRWPGPAAVRVRIGHPIPPPDGGSRAVVDSFMARIREAVQELSDEFKTCA